MSTDTPATNDIPKPVVSGEALVTDFLSAMTNLTTAATAQYSAEQSESITIETIKAAAEGRYANPHNFPVTSQEDLVRSSLNAHIQKVQADQISTLAQTQTNQTEIDINQRYRGKKVLVTVLDTPSQPVESYWFDSRTGMENHGVMKTSKVKGIIEDISLFKNMLVLKPTATSRMLLPNRKYFIVYVVNPQTLAPMVTLSLI